jgi:hypothetical protein
MQNRMALAEASASQWEVEPKLLEEELWYPPVRALMLQVVQYP